MNMINYTEIIAKYIAGELSETDKGTFERELNTNTDLKKEYDLQLEIVEGAKRLGLKNQVATSFKTVKTKKLITKTLIGLAITVAVIGAAVLVKKTINKNASEVLYELNEQGNTNWSEADKKIESQVFKLNPLRDTIIETQNGIVFSIPAKAFLNKHGETPTETIDVEIKEAMAASEIMKAGLSTMSNGKLLETGGMFYVNARVGEENLTIDKSKPLNANVPVNNNKRDMLLFKGERKADGSINWVDPKPMKKKLTTVDITKLNFYPEHFLDSLKGMGFDIKNKKLTDSIYYSFSGDCHFAVPTSPPSFDSEEEFAYSFDESISDTVSNISKGENLFKRNCAVCHTMTDQKLTGPGLAGILNRVPSGDWLKRYILNNEKMIKSGDVYANKIYNENGKAAMTVFEGTLNDGDMQQLLNYITGQSYMNIDNTAGKEECPEINPAKIKAIWDKKFNKTILATKEFEERLKVVFATCEPRILNLYINNLDKNLYEIDSTAATLVGGEIKNKFLEFYNRRDGGVEISTARNNKLQNYFEEKRTLYANAVTKTLQKMYASENEKTQEAFAEELKHSNNEAIRSTSTFTQELELNMDEAYRQLGKERQKIILPIADGYYTAPVVLTGWYNVDKYVVESTVNRTTLNYTDPESGKKAIIKYEPITITVDKFKDYDRVVCYMIPDKLSSFQLMNNTTNVFKEKLNELMNYSIITVGFKGAKTFYNEIKSAKAKPYTVDLASIKSSDLDKKLNASFPLNQQTDILKDINYQLFDIKENARQKQIQRREELKNRLYPIVFPCASPAAQPSVTLDVADK
jgi:cytochrome c2